MVYMHFLKLLKGSKWAITMHPISIESTLLLFLLIKNFLGGTKKLLQDICVSKHLSIYPYILLFKSTGVQRSSRKIVAPENICLLLQMLFPPQSIWKISVEIFTAIVFLLSETLRKVEVLHRIVSSGDNT